MKTISVVMALMAGLLWWGRPALAQRVSWSVTIGDPAPARRCPAPTPPVQIFVRGSRVVVDCAVAEPRLRYGERRCSCGVPLSCRCFYGQPPRWVYERGPQRVYYPAGYGGPGWIQEWCPRSRAWITIERAPPGAF